MILTLCNPPFRLVFLLASAILLSLTGSAQDLVNANDLNLVQTWIQEPGGWNYPVAVSVPNGPTPAEGHPVCILLHGNGNTGQSMLFQTNSWLQDHIRIAPTGYMNSWNLCGENSDAPDIDMLADLIDQLSAFDNVNTDHIRMVGSSNGGGLVNQAFIELDHPGLDAFVAFVSQMNEPQFHNGAFHRPSGQTNAPLPFCGYDEVVEPVQGRRYLSICNTNDNMIPYGGGPAVGNFFLPAEFAIHQVAIQQGHIGPAVTGEAIGGTALVEFSYLGGDVVLLQGDAGHGSNPDQIAYALEFLAFEDEGDDDNGGNGDLNCPEDLDFDGVISVADVLLLLGQFGCAQDCGPFDITGNGLVGVSDVLAMLNVFGLPCVTIPELPTVTIDSTYAFTVDEGIVYGQGLSHQFLNSAASVTMPLLLDAYVPVGAGENRPAIVVIHGGGFTGGSRGSLPPVSIAEYFASRGWVAFSIDYRVSSDFGTIPQQWIDWVMGAELSAYQVSKALAIYPAHRDAKAALRWVAAHAEDYGINLDHLTVGGGSAGGVASIGVSVTESTDYTNELSVLEDPTLLTTNLGQEYEVQTILDFWGSGSAVDLLDAVYGLDRFDPEDPALFIAHGTEDATVLYSNALLLQEIWMNLGLPHVLYTLEGAGHGPWEVEVLDADGNLKSLHALAFDFIVEQQMLQVE